MLTDIELVAFYTAAMIHDFDHPGLNNNFLVHTLDRKALMYNDKAVLENHHLASSFNILLHPECNFLVGLSRPDFKLIRETIIEMVLATDLSQHFHLIASFKNKVI